MITISKNFIIQYNFYGLDKPGIWFKPGIGELFIAEIVGLRCVVEGSLFVIVGGDNSLEVEECGSGKVEETIDEEVEDAGVEVVEMEDDAMLLILFSIDEILDLGNGTVGLFGFEILLFNPGILGEANENELVFEESIIVDAT